MKKTLLITFAALFPLTQGLSAQDISFDNLMSNLPKPSDELPAMAAPAAVDVQPRAAAQSSGLYTFNAPGFPGFYDASSSNIDPYNIPEIVRDIPEMWKEFGPLFKKAGAAMEMDPYALAAYCVFESYNEKTHTFNPGHLDGTAAGIASTQAKDVNGGKIPGLDIRLPRDISGTKTVLRDNPEYGLRFLAAEFKAWYLGGDHFINYYGEELYRKIFGGGDFQGYRDLAKAFPRVALPGWKKPGERKGNYGTQAQYVSRAYVLYNAFRSADAK